MSHIEVIALRSFPWSEDGYTEIQAVEKSTFLLPERLFEGLNKIGYVRRAAIGDGHVLLHPGLSDATVPFIPATMTIEETPTPRDEIAPAGDIAPESPTEEPAKEATEGNAVAGHESGAVSTTKAPQPPARTAELTDEEKAALADGSWKDWRFFKQRSVAAKVSDKAILNGDDAKAAIEAYLAGE